MSSVLTIRHDNFVTKTSDSNYAILGFLWFDSATFSSEGSSFFIARIVFLDADLARIGYFVRSDGLPLHEDKLFSHLTPFITSSNCVSKNLSIVSFDFPWDFLKYRANAMRASWLRCVYIFSKKFIFNSLISHLMSLVYFVESWGWSVYEFFQKKIEMDLPWWA